MYDLIDRPTDTLATFERETLRSLRKWVHAMTTLGGGMPGEAMGGDGAFDVAMRLLDRDTPDDLVIHRPCHSHVGEDEAVLVGLWRLVRDGRRDSATATAVSLVGRGSSAALLAAVDLSLDL